MTIRRVLLILLFVTALGIVPAAAQNTAAPVTVAVGWAPQAQFAGYYAADALGYYTAEGLAVTFLDPRPTLDPQAAVIDGQADFGIDWLGNVLATRANGGDVTAIAQVFSDERGGALAQVTEFVGPNGEFPVYTADDLIVVDGTVQLQSTLFVRGAWLAEPASEEIVIRFLRGTFRGWDHCRDNLDECALIMARADAQFGEATQRWLVNEVNQLIWPAASGVGVLERSAFNATADLALGAGIIGAPPDGEGRAYRSDLAQIALDSLLFDYDLDVTGRGYSASTVAPPPANS
ncbi:MAG: ABC transporter substrate-binding protein [Chloroflexi bacterium]|nr:ABC transporter substrate-binding protein [Chloroflexota bacterium]